MIKNAILDKQNISDQFPVIEEFFDAILAVAFGFDLDSRVPYAAACCFQASVTIL